MRKNKFVHLALVGGAFVLGVFPILEYFLAQQGLSTCGENGVGCQVVGLVTPYGSTPFFVLGALFGFALSLAAFFRMQILFPALLCAGVVMEGVLLAFQINLGFFCRFCLIYSVGVFLLTGLYLALAPRTFNIFAIPFGTAFLSIFLLYFSFAGASLEKAFIAEEDLGGSDQGTFYLFYSHTCGHCIKTLQILDHNKEKLAGKFRLVVTDTKVGQAEVTKQAEGNLFVRGLKGVAGDPIEVSEDTIDQCSTARRYMAKHAISETPTMIVVDGTNWTTTIHGTTNIVAYLSLRFGQEIVREIP